MLVFSVGGQEQKKEEARQKKESLACKKNH